MANTFTDIIDSIFAQGMLALRESSIMPRLVNTNWDQQVAQQGDTINVPLPSSMEVSDVAPSNTPPAGGDLSPTTVPIQLNRWRQTTMHVTDKEAREIVQGARSLQLSEAMRVLANDVDSYLLSQYKDVFGYAGTAGATPFETDLSAATLARKVLGDQKAPMNPRRIVLGTAAEANALLLRPVQDATFRANQANTLLTGQIATLLGFDWFVDQLIPRHVAGTITTGLASKAATSVPAGSRSFAATTAASTGECALVVGDIIEIAGHDGTYVVTQNATQGSAATDVTLHVSPGLRQPLTGGEAITVKDSHEVNLAFHRDAFALAVRPLAPADGFSGGNEIRTGIDPVSGLALTLEVSREHNRTKYQWSILYGAKLIRPELAVRIAG